MQFSGLTSQVIPMPFSSALTNYSIGARMTAGGVDEQAAPSCASPYHGLIAFFGVTTGARSPYITSNLRYKQISPAIGLCVRAPETPDVDQRGDFPTSTPGPKRTSERSVNRLEALFLQAFEMVLHFLQSLGGVAFPIRDLACDAERFTGAVGLRWIPRKFFVCQVGVVHDRSGRLYNVDPSPFFADSQLGAPNGRVQRAGQINPRRLFARAVIRTAADSDQVSRF